LRTPDLSRLIFGEVQDSCIARSFLSSSPSRTAYFPSFPFFCHAFQFSFRGFFLERVSRPSAATPALSPTFWKRLCPTCSKPALQMFDSSFSVTCPRADRAWFFFLISFTSSPSLFFDHFAAPARKEPFFSPRNCIYDAPPLFFLSKGRSFFSRPRGLLPQSLFVFFFLPISRRIHASCLFSSLRL